MTVVLVSGGLTFVVGLLILRPFSITGGRLQVRAHTPDDSRRRELLRQLRDLDDDLASGKLTQADHVRLRGPVEREAAAVLHRKTRGPAGGARAATSGPRSGSAAADPPQGRNTGGARRWRRRTVTILVRPASRSCLATRFPPAPRGRRSRVIRFPGPPRRRAARAAPLRRLHLATGRPPRGSWPQ
jgi:hypothetical protein